MTSTPLEPSLKDKVFEICENLYKNSEKITRKKVRDVLGGGSYEYISPLVTEWKNLNSVQNQEIEGTETEEQSNVEPTTPKQMLLEITQQFELPTEDIEGKNLTVDKLKRAIAEFLGENTAFIVLDDAQNCDMKFRIWLKQLRRKGVPMLVLATDPMVN